MTREALAQLAPSCCCKYGQSSFRSTLRCCPALLQVHAKLELLTSPGMKMDAFRSARAYDLWQLAELAQDEACKNEILSSDFGPSAVFLLQDAQFPSMQAAAAVLIRRLVANSPEHGQQLTNCGGYALYSALPRVMCCG